MNLVVTNVPGPPVPFYLAGAELLELFPMMPTMGNLTLVVAALSYAGQLNITAVADRVGCPDVEVFAQACVALSTISRDRCLRPPHEAVGSTGPSKGGREPGGEGPQRREAV